MAKLVSQEEYNSLIQYAQFKVEEKTMEESTGDSWENFLLDVLEANVKENRWYSIKGEILQWLLLKYFVERSYWNNKIQEQTIEYKSTKPSERWIANMLRKLPHTKTKLVRGLTQVNLNPSLVSELVKRLRSQNSEKFLREMEENIDSPRKESKMEE